MSIIPGIETAAPERTDTSSGSSGSPSACPSCCSSRPTWPAISSSRPSGRLPQPHELDTGLGRDGEARREPESRAQSSRRGRLPCRRAARGPRPLRPRSCRRTASWRRDSSCPACPVRPSGTSAPAFGRIVIVGEEDGNPRPSWRPARLVGAACSPSACVREGDDEAEVVSKRSEPATAEGASGFVRRPGRVRGGAAATPPHRSRRTASRRSSGPAG